MNVGADLRQVAARLGIHVHHTDALGDVHDASEETVAALIGAFGFPIDAERAGEALEAVHRSAPLGLDPVQILHAEDARPELRVRLPDAATVVEWACRLEEGRHLSGNIEVRPTGNDGEAIVTLPGGWPLGYHQLELRAATISARVGLIVAPPSCHLPDALGSGARSWGLTTQLYGLRGGHDWGMGDFTDLAVLSRRAGQLGAAVVGLNPLHALFAAEPRHVSPYSPSSRMFLDLLYIDVTGVPGFSENAAAQALASEAAIASARKASLVDHEAVAALKRPVLEALFRRFRLYDLEDGEGARTGRGRAFRDFQRDGGSALLAFATFEALHEHFGRDGGHFSWRTWPEPMRDPLSTEVAQFARTRRDRVEFFAFLQWEADRQLGAAAMAGRESGLTVGLYRDLAVGVDPNGAEAWADQRLVAPGAAIGAPPDALSRAGQNWGLAPVNPLSLRQRGFAPFVASLRANMRHAGVLRIDHVMALKRLYWIPSGIETTAGAYVDYPFEDLLRLVALESRRHECAVIGEDLGTVPEGFRETMQAANVLSYRVVAFERREGGFVAPADYPPLAAASAATHDIATLKGFWLGRDIEWRRRLDLYPDAEADATETQERTRDRQWLLEALAAEGLLAVERFGEFLTPTGTPIFNTELGDAILTFLARSRARLMLVQLEDVAGESEQANLPGTTDAHPNWRRRMSRSLEGILGGPELPRIAARVEEGRRRSAEHARPVAQDPAS